MNKRLNECLNGNYGSYILPFLWMHGESKERLKEEILAIRNSSIHEFCVESRPYDNFCQDSWWDDFQFILETAESLNMKVWLLDDRLFPTGYANGYLESPDKAHLLRVMIREKQSEVVGPLKCAKIYVGSWLVPGKNEEIVSVIAYKHSDADEGLDGSSAIDLTDKITDGCIYWDVPEGVWRICVAIKTSALSPQNDRFSYYIDMLNPESCHAMIDAIYEPHFRRFGKYFGNTFKGFFSDEPGFQNTRGEYSNTLGNLMKPYPWRDDIPALIAESAGVDEGFVRKNIHAIFEDLGDITSLIRTHYMEVITKLYSENFSWALGNWCRDHGVMYIGHVIEDLNAHMRLGYGSGHFFRALDGQDMAGMDIVLMEDIPGITKGGHRAPLPDTGYCQPEFFHYTVPKMTASHSHIQPLKKGRAMCEIFGAFGWAEGFTYMKQLADLMLASGINYFVPHAFSPKEDDPDCPPHFYNGGKNPMYPLFKNLMEYMGRTAHILTDGVHKASVAVFYNAEGEWSGGRNQLFQYVCSNLTKGLIDFDIIPFDILEKAEMHDGKLKIADEEYGALIVSESEILPISRLECFSCLAKKGLPVIFTDSLPEKSAEGKNISDIKSDFISVPTSSLADYLREIGCYEITAVKGNAENLRFYHKKQDTSDVYIFSNEGVTQTLDVHLDLGYEGEFVIYDPWENKCYKTETRAGLFHLVIEKGNALIAVLRDDVPENLPELKYEKERKTLPLLFDVYLKDKENGDCDFRLYAEKTAPFDITAPGRIPDFSGEILYKTTFVPTPEYNVIDLGQVGETAEVWLNGEYLGVRVNAPYKFDISKAYPDKENTLEIKVSSNPGHRRKDSLSKFIWVPPTGIIEDISLCKY